MQSIQGAQSKDAPAQWCSKCNGERWILVDTNGDRKMHACECQVQEKIKHRLPPQYREAKLYDFKAPAIEAILGWFAGDKPSLFLHGPAGTGKTHLAAAIVRLLLMANIDARFFEMAEIYRRIRSSFNSEVPEESVINSLVETHWLVLDDFAAGNLSDFERRYALELIDRRICRQKRTIITSNLDLEEIRDRMDERISSRLSSFADIKLAGKDRRAA